MYETDYAVNARCVQCFIVVFQEDSSMVMCSVARFLYVVSG